MIEEVRLATTDEVVAELRKRRVFVMVSHVKPDGDTLGAGLVCLLEELHQRQEEA